MTQAETILGSSPATTPPPSAPQGGSVGEPSNPPAGTSSWRDTLPDDLKNDPSLATFADVSQLAKSYTHAQRMVGADKIPIPGKLATEEDWKAVYKKLGVPDSADKYDIKVPEKTPVDENFIKSFKEQALKTGMLPHQAQKFVEWIAEGASARSAEMNAARKTQTESGIAALKTEWGQGYDKKVQAAQVAVSEFGGDELTAYLEKTGLGNDPMMIKLLAKVGESLKEDKIAGNGSTRLMGKTPDEIQGEINTIMGNPADPYNVAQHPNHALAVEEMNKRFQSLAGG